MLPVLAGLGDLLPGAAFVLPGTPAPVVAPGIGEVIIMPPDAIGRGAIVIVIGMGECIDFIDPPILPPAFTAVALQTYLPLPLPYCAEPFA